MSKTVIRGGSIFDPLTIDITRNESLVIDDGVVTPSGNVSGADLVLDADGHFCCPGSSMRTSTSG